MTCIGMLSTKMPCVASQMHVMDFQKREALEMMVALLKCHESLWFQHTLHFEMTLPHSTCS